MKAYYPFAHLEENKLMLSQKDRLSGLADALKHVVGFDIIIVDQYLNRIVNTYVYQNCEGNDIRLNSVVGNIVTTKQSQIVYQRRQFDDCRRCPDFSECEVGGIVGCPILSGDICLGAIGYLIRPEQIEEFASRQEIMMQFLLKFAQFIAQIIRSESSANAMKQIQAELTGIFDSVESYLAVTDENGMVLMANKNFLEFFKGMDLSESIETLMSKNIAAWATDKWFPGIPGVYHSKDSRMIYLARRSIVGQRQDATTLMLYEFRDLSEEEYQSLHLRSIPRDVALQQVFGTSESMQRARRLTENAMENRLSLLIESRDPFLAERLMRLVNIYGPPSRQVHLDCQQETGSLSAVIHELKRSILRPDYSGRGYTIFLHRVEFLPQYLQSQLLSLIESSGDNRRVCLAATSCTDVSELVSRRLFLRRLYSLLCLNHIVLPEFTSCGEDLHDGFTKLINFFCQVYNREEIVIEPEAWRMIERFDWRSSFRYMRAMAERVVMELEGSRLTLGAATEIFGDEIREKAPLGTVEQKIEAQLRQLLGTNRSKDAIAREMGVSRATLYRWIKKYEIT